MTAPLGRRRARSVAIVTGTAFAATAARDRLVPWMVGLMSVAVLAMAVSRYL